MDDSVRPEPAARATSARLLARAYRLARRIARAALTPPPLFADRYVIEDRSEVTIYVATPALFRGYPRRRSLPGTIPGPRVRVALVATARNEIASLSRWIAGITSQTRAPDEVVVTDTGSTDGTLQALQDWQRESRVPVRVISAPGANIARGRNLAIAAAASPVIAVTDFGCAARPDWLANLVAPFEVDPETEVVAGRYHAVDRHGRPARWRVSFEVHLIDPQRFLPAACSVAFTRQAWQRVGGYPEWLTMTGEDTVFDLELKRACPNWAFVPEAIVDWEAPESMVEYWKKMYKWSIGDGESGVHGSHYWRGRAVPLLLGSAGAVAASAASLLLFRSGNLVLRAGAAIVVGAWLVAVAFRARRAGLDARDLVVELGGNVARVGGYIAGARRRREIERRRRALVLDASSPDP